MNLDPARLQAALDTARQALLAERNAEGHWTGELSSSALATATAVVALQQVQTNTDADHATYIEGGLNWLATNANTENQSSTRNALKGRNLFRNRQRMAKR